MVDWGSVPAYFGGLALVLTIMVMLRDRQEKVRGQANQIAAWVERSYDDSEPHRVVVKNASNLPCIDLSVWMTVGYRDPKKLRLSKTFGVDTDGRKKPHYLHAVGPGEKITVLETTSAVAVRALYFVDASGRKWVRRHTKLVRDRITWGYKALHRFKRAYLPVRKWSINHYTSARAWIASPRDRASGQ